MDWAKQSEDVLSAWTDAQKKIWGGWMESAEQNSGQAEVADTWRQAIDTWEGITKKSLDAQLEWSQRASETLGALPNMPKDLADWSKQTQQLGTRWNDAQKELWESYFGMVRKAIPVKMLGTFDDENQRLFRAWQESVQKVVEAQTHWSNVWAEQTPKGASASTEASAKSKKKTTTSKVA